MRLMILRSVRRHVLCRTFFPSLRELVLGRSTSNPLHGGVLRHPWLSGASDRRSLEGRQAFRSACRAYPEIEGGGRGRGRGYCPPAFTANAQPACTNQQKYPQERLHQPHKIRRDHQPTNSRSSGIVISGPRDNRSFVGRVWRTQQSTSIASTSTYIHTWTPTSI